MKTVFNNVWPVSGGEPCSVCMYNYTNMWSIRADVPVCDDCCNMVRVKDLPNKYEWFKMCADLRKHILRKEFNKEYWKNNKEELSATQAEHNKTTAAAKRRREYYQEYNKKYLADKKNVDRRNAYAKAYHKKNKDVK